MPESQLLQISHDSAVIDSQKLVGRSGHVDIVVFAFLSFTVKELEYRIVSGCMLNESRHDLEKGLAQSGRATLGNVPAFRFKGTRLARWSVYTSKSHQNPSKPGSATRPASSTANRWWSWSR